MFTRLLQLRGMKVLATDLMASRLKLARQFGARPPPRRPISNLKSQISNRASRNLDAAVLAVPSDAALRQAIQCVCEAPDRPLVFAHTRRGAMTGLDLASVCVDEKDLLGSYSSDFTLQEEVAKLVFSRKLDVRPLITHRFPLSQTAAAIELAARLASDSLKVVVALG